VGQVSWLLCDYGEVLSLAPPPPDREALEEAASWRGGSDAFWAAYWENRPGYDRGDVSAYEYWTSVLRKDLDEGELARIVDADVAGWLHPNLRSVQAVEKLMERGVSLALFSNAPVEVAAGIGAAPWLASFSRKFFSCDLRAVKPEPAAYEAVLEGLGAGPEQVLFVDDRPVNVAGAEAVGIRAVLFESPEQLARVL
jgi:putative hydrolase of the HAD superfamily